MEKKEEVNSLIGKEIIESMTQEQLTFLINSLLSLLDDKKKKHLLNILDKKIADTLSQILDPSKKSSNHTATDSKYQEDWRKLWDKWYNFTSELGDEDGKYVFQEHHWETPEYDGYAFSNDLEKVSEELLTILDKIYSLNIEDDEFFQDELKDIESSISDYPDWMGSEYSECILGLCTTICFLKWEWNVARSREQPSKTFLERIIAIEDNLRIIELDGTAFVDFFTSLPEDVRRQLYEHIKANKNNPDWEKRLKSIYSKWHKIYDSLSSSFNTEEYLENCLKYLPENWRYGLPLVENLLQRKEYIQAEEFIEKTFSSFLRFEQSKEWLPEGTLLIVAMRYHSQDREDRIIKLLQNWTLIAEGLGNKKRAAMLSVQLTIYKDPFQWNVVLNEFKKLMNSSFSGSVKPLLWQWQNLDYLCKAKGQIEKQLYYRLLGYGLDNSLVLYDITSTYFEGEQAEIEKRGFSRDKRGDLDQIVVGIVMSRDGIPIAHHVFEGNRLDKTTVKEVVEDLKKPFGIKKAIFVGDRGMITLKNIETIKEYEYEYILGLQKRNRKVVDHLLEKVLKNPEELIQEFGYTDLSSTLQRKYPEEVRFVAGYNKEVARKTRRTRDRNIAFFRGLIEETRLVGDLKTIKNANDRLKWFLSKKRMTRWYKLNIEKEGEKESIYRLKVQEMTAVIEGEENLDGRYFIQTEVSENIDKNEIERSYKSLQKVEQAFRIVKDEFDIRPMHVRKETRIRGHVMISYFALLIETLMEKKLKDLFPGAYNKHEKAVKTSYISTKIDNNVKKLLSGVGVRNAMNPENLSFKRSKGKSDKDQLVLDLGV